MPTRQIFITDYSFENLDPERELLADTGCEIISAQCKTPEQVIDRGADAEVLMVQWVPITAAVMAALPRLRLIVRYGIGVDNLDLAAAKQRGIAVCNVPDYSIDEVADHAVATAVALGRQLPQLDRRLRSGVWKLAPVSPMPAFRQMTFAVAGFGRIGRAVLDRARGFKFKLAAYDPFVSADRMEEAGVEKLSLEQLFAHADMLSLHLPLSAETKHLINAERLLTMKPTAVIVNTARGGLIDTQALAAALTSRRIAYAGLDVFETEPLPLDHPIRQCENVLITSHVAWYSDASLSQLQRMAAAEARRYLQGEPLQNQLK